MTVAHKIWIRFPLFSPRKIDMTKPISRKEVLEISRNILEKAESERLPQKQKGYFSCLVVS